MSSARAAERSMRVIDPRAGARYVMPEAGREQRLEADYGEAYQLARQVFEKQDRCAGHGQQVEVRPARAQPELDQAVKGKNGLLDLDERSSKRSVRRLRLITIVLLTIVLR